MFLVKVQQVETKPLLAFSDFAYDPGGPPFCFMHTKYCEILRGTHRKLGLKIWPALLVLKFRTEIAKCQTFFTTRANLDSGPRLLIFPSLGIHSFTPRGTACD